MLDVYDSNDENMIKQQVEGQRSKHYMFRNLLVWDKPLHGQRFEAYHECLRTGRFQLHLLHRKHYKRRRGSAGRQLFAKHVLHACI
jgi:hypothetical protein